MNQKEAIIKYLHEKGYRLTEQRKLLIGIILEGSFNTCKEIYYKAVKQDPAIGIATVYRTLSILEDLNVIHKSCIYTVVYGNVESEDKL